MGMFGWDLPPGCTHRHIDEAFGQEGPCEVCGQSVDDCICPECPTCGSVGDPYCYCDGPALDRTSWLTRRDSHGLVRSFAQVTLLAQAEKAWEEENKATCEEENRVAQATKEFWEEENRIQSSS